MPPSLSSAQLAAYDRDGFVVTPNVFTRPELAEMDAEFDRIIDEQATMPDPPGQPGRGWLLRLGLLSDKTAEYCADDRVLDLISPIVRPGIAIYSAKLVSKEPRDPEPCHWHQDDAYYVSRSSSAVRKSIWVPLTDVAPAQGCLRVVPGSHKRGLQPTKKRPNGTCDLSIATQFDLSDAVDVPITANKMVLFSALLYHSSEGNTTDTRRRAFIVSYQEGAVTEGNGAQCRLLRQQ